MNFYFFLFVFYSVNPSANCGFLRALRGSTPTAFRNQTVAPSGFPSISISTPRLFQARGSASTLRRYPHADFKSPVSITAEAALTFVITSSGEMECRHFVDFAVLFRSGTVIAGDTIHFFQAQQVGMGIDHLRCFSGIKGTNAVFHHELDTPEQGKSLFSMSL